MPRARGVTPNHADYKALLDSIICKLFCVRKKILFVRNFSLDLSLPDCDAEITYKSSD
jgi:hypothetical protein